MKQEIREYILKLFASENEGNLSNIELNEKEFFNNIDEGNPIIAEIYHELDKLVLEEKCIRYLDYPNPNQFYKLTPLGIVETKKLYGIDFNIKLHIDNINDIITQLGSSKINDRTKGYYTNLIEEMAVCYINNCHFATILLCGKLIEVYFSELANHYNIPIEEDLTLVQLHKKISSDNRIVTDLFDNSMNIKLITNYVKGDFRNKEIIGIPSQDIVEGVISFTIDNIRRRLTYKWE